MINYEERTVIESSNHYVLEVGEVDVDNGNSVRMYIIRNTDYNVDEYVTNMLSLVRGKLQDYENAVYGDGGNNDLLQEPPVH